jgi:hypothetical protein
MYYPYGWKGRKERRLIFYQYFESYVVLPKINFKNISPKNLCFLEVKSVAFYYTMLALCPR